MAKREEPEKTLSTGVNIDAGGGVKIGGDGVGGNKTTTVNNGVVVLGIVALVVFGVIGVLAIIYPGRGSPSPFIPTAQANATLIPTITNTSRPSDTPMPTDTATPAPTDTNTPIPPTPIATLGIGSTMVSSKDGMTLVYVPAGEFLMGSIDADIYAGSDEKPQHTVYLDAYWIDKTDVTNAMFAQFVQAASYKTDAEKVGIGYSFDFSSGNWTDTRGANWQHPHGPSSDISNLDNHPVAQVSWNDAKAYCEWAGRRLPTEAEWEKAARGTDGSIYPWGNDPATGNLLNLADKNLNASWADKTIDDGYQFTSPVGHYPAGISPYGALDMAGNVWQWVVDWYDKNYYVNSPTRNPTGPTSGDSHVLRGGSWNFRAQSARAACRSWNAPGFRYVSISFRCAR